eukprot:scaffold19764_cov114-Isochrysis_galbana.AAC.9
MRRCITCRARVCVAVRVTGSAAHVGGRRHKRPALLHALRRVHQLIPRRHQLQGKLILARGFGCAGSCLSAAP